MGEGRYKFRTLYRCSAVVAGNNTNISRIITISRVLIQITDSQYNTIQSPIHRYLSVGLKAFLATTEHTAAWISCTVKNKKPTRSRKATEPLGQGWKRQLLSGGSKQDATEYISSQIIYLTLLALVVLNMPEQFS